MSKLLLNLLVQISKAFVYSKIKFYLEKKFLTFGPTGPAASQPIQTFGPAAALFSLSNRPSPRSLPTEPRPLGQPSSPHGPTGHLLPPPAPEPNAQGAAAGRPRTAPTVDPNASTRREKMAASIPLHSPIDWRHSPSSITGNRRLQSGATEAPSTPAIEGARPPLPRLRPIKDHPALGEDSHTSNAPSLSPQHALAVALPSRSSATAATPSFPSPAPRSELSSIGGAGG
jgi:hypothetical protein